MLKSSSNGNMLLTSCNTSDDDNSSLELFLKTYNLEYLCSTLKELGVIEVSDLRWLTSDLIDSIEVAKQMPLIQRRKFECLVEHQKCIGNHNDDLMKTQQMQLIYNKKHESMKYLLDTKKITSIEFDEWRREEFFKYFSNKIDHRSVSSLDPEKPDDDDLMWTGLTSRDLQKRESFCPSSLATKHDQSNFVANNTDNASLQNTDRVTLIVTPVVDVVSSPAIVTDRIDTENSFYNGSFRVNETTTNQDMANICNFQNVEANPFDHVSLSDNSDGFKMLLSSENFHSNELQEYDEVEEHSCVTSDPLDVTVHTVPDVAIGRQTETNFQTQIEVVIQVQPEANIHTQPETTSQVQPSAVAQTQQSDLYIEEVMNPERKGKGESVSEGNDTDDDNQQKSCESTMSISNEPDDEDEEELLFKQKGINKASDTMMSISNEPDNEKDEEILPRQEDLNKVTNTAISVSNSQMEVHDKEQHKQEVLSLVSPIADYFKDYSGRGNLFKNVLTILMKFGWHQKVLSQLGAKVYIPQWSFDPKRQKGLHGYMVHGLKLNTDYFDNYDMVLLYVYKYGLNSPYLAVEKGEKAYTMDFENFIVSPVPSTTNSNEIESDTKCRSFLGFLVEQNSRKNDDLSYIPPYEYQLLDESLLSLLPFIFKVYSSPSVQNDRKLQDQNSSAQINSENNDTNADIEIDEEQQLQAILCEIEETEKLLSMTQVEDEKYGSGNYEDLAVALPGEFKKTDTYGDNNDTDDDDNVVCQVCFDDEISDDDLIVFCDECDIAVHQSCYSVETLPDGPWYCDVCALKKNPDKIACKICNFKGGAFKQTVHADKFVHALCAAWIPEVYNVSGRQSRSGGRKVNSKHKKKIEDTETLHNKRVCIEKLNPERFKLICSVCHKRGSGACIQCHYKRCSKAVHPYCAFSHLVTNGANHNRKNNHTSDIPEFSPGLVQNANSTGDSVDDWKMFCRDHLPEEYRLEYEAEKLSNQKELDSVHPIHSDVNNVSQGHTDEPTTLMIEVPNENASTSVNLSTLETETEATITTITLVTEEQKFDEQEEGHDDDNEEQNNTVNFLNIQLKRDRKGRFKRKLNNQNNNKPSVDFDETVTISDPKLINVTSTVSTIDDTAEETAINVSVIESDVEAAEKASAENVQDNNLMDIATVIQKSSMETVPVPVVLQQEMTTEPEINKENTTTTTRDELQQNKVSTTTTTRESILVDATEVNMSHVVHFTPITCVTNEMSKNTKSTINSSSYQVSTDNDSETEIMFTRSSVTAVAPKVKTAENIIDDVIIWKLIENGTKIQINKYLKSNPAAVNRIGGEKKCTPLYYACVMNKMIAVGVLIENGCDINKTNSNGSTAVHEACRRHYFKIAFLLASYGGNIYVKNKDGMRPIDMYGIQFKGNYERLKMCYEDYTTKIYLNHQKQTSSNKTTVQTTQNRAMITLYNDTEELTLDDVDTLMSVVDTDFYLYESAHVHFDDMMENSSEGDKRRSSRLNRCPFNKTSTDTMSSKNDHKNNDLDDIDCDQDIDNRPATSSSFFSSRINRSHINRHNFGDDDLPDTLENCDHDVLENLTNMFSSTSSTPCLDPHIKKRTRTESVSRDDAGRFAPCNETDQFQETMDLWHKENITYLDQLLQESFENNKSKGQLQSSSSNHPFGEDDEFMYAIDTHVNKPVYPSGTKGTK